jgi:hypothetical protein
MRRRAAALSATLALAACADAPPPPTDAHEFDAPPPRAEAGLVETDAHEFDAPPPEDALARDARAPDAGTQDARAGDGGCVTGMAVDAIAACVDEGTAPNACLARARAAAPAPLCDEDRDGLEDDFEDALQRAYAMVFAFNQGNGTSALGSPESCWPGNAEDTIANSRLIWRVDNDARTTVVAAEGLTPDLLGRATVMAAGSLRVARDPAAGHGANFWLCLRTRSGGGYDPALTLDTIEHSLALRGGIDVAGVVHPANGPGDARHVFVASVLYYPYNRHSTVDNHEGDWEGAGVLVDRTTGAVVAAYFDRHPSEDNAHLVVLGAAGYPALDPSRESPAGELCTEAAARAVKGIRFWDWNTRRHHAVVYVSTGGHAGYDMPGNTKILGVGCGTLTAPRDTHNGDGVKLVPWLGGFARAWGGPVTQRPVGGVHLRNLGEDDRPRVSWAAYHGQWGCQHELVAKSYPGPWDNARHCRRWITHRWGAAVPFVTANPSADCSSPP